MRIETNGAVEAQSVGSDSGTITAPSRGEESEHVVIGRLIRRLRISDPPDRFQELATTVLRSSLGVAAVAWVPRDPHEPVIVGGSVEGLDAQTYRLLPAPAGRETIVVRNEITAGLSQIIPPNVIALCRRVGRLARLPDRGQPARRPALRPRRGRATPVRRLVDRDPARQRQDLCRSQGVAFRHHPRPHRRHRRQGPLHVGTLRARGTDRRPDCRRAQDARCRGGATSMSPGCCTTSARSASRTTC